MGWGCRKGVRIPAHLEKAVPRADGVAGGARSASGPARRERRVSGLVESLGELYAEAWWQEYVVHRHRNAWSQVPKVKAPEVTAMLIAIDAQENREAALTRAA